jgi:hypothetical protein
MAAIFKIKRKIQGTGGGSKAAPTGGAEGELALWFPGSKGDPDKPTLYACDGTGWREVNPSVSVTTQSIDLGKAAGGVGGAAAAWLLVGGNAITGNVVIATYANGAAATPEAYVLVDPSKPNLDASWVSLGGAVQFATAAEIRGGSNTIKAINPDALRQNTVAVPSAVPGDDNQHFIMLGATGKIDRGFLDLKVQHIGLSAGADVGAAFNAWVAKAGNAIDGQVVVADFGTPPKSYLLIDPTSPGTKASWTVLGGSVDFASATEVHAGVEDTKALNSKLLRDETVVIPDGTPANDANHLIRLGTGGKIDAGFLPAAPTKMRGSVDVTVPLVQPDQAHGGPYVAGDMIFVKAPATGASPYTVDSSYAGIPATEKVKSGDSLLFDGTNWHAIPNETDLAAYIPLAGTNQLAGKLLWAADQTGNIVIDCNNGIIENVLLDAGTYG